ncbi:MAG: hypothetical protein JXR61_01625, partial [Prolixibacteraceae bacterium]|nr:hypothetical protein [Prolixibacteraceae bacterium]
PGQFPELVTMERPQFEPGQWQHHQNHRPTKTGTLEQQAGATSSGHNSRAGAMAAPPEPEP